MPTLTTDPVIDNLRTERDRARDAAIALAEGEGFDPTAEAYVGLETRASSLDSQIETLVTLHERRSAADALSGRMARSATRAEAREVEAPPSVGETFVRSEAFRNYSFTGSSGRVLVDESALETRALPTGIADLIAAGWKGSPTRIDTTPPQAPTPLLDNISEVGVSGNSIEYVAWRKVAGGAAKVAEKAGKPSAEFGPVITPATLDTIAVYTQLTRQLIEDEPAARDAINNLMRFDVLRAEEAEATAALTGATALIPNASGGDLLASIRNGVGAVQSQGYSPNAVLLNPADWAELDIQVMRTTPGGPTSTSVFWGLTPIPSTAQPAGTAVVGDFRSGLTHYTRSGVSLYVTDSHGDTFLSNIFTILAERRSKTVVVRPNALAECTVVVIP